MSLVINGLLFCHEMVERKNVSQAELDVALSYLPNNSSILKGYNVSFTAYDRNYYSVELPHNSRIPYSISNCNLVFYIKIS